MTRLHAAGITDVGQRREGNEDALHVGDSVFAVADGMGGHAAGEVASALALEPIALLDGRVFGDVEEARAALLEAVVAANRAVVAAAEGDDTLSGMGTTLTAALFEGQRLHVAHVGDSRAYLLRDGRVRQITRDHTFVQQLLDDGSITEDEVATHPHRSVVTRAIGARADVEVDLETITLHDDDVVLLCSDGLSGVVADETIARLLLSGESPELVVRALVRAANAAGGPDNITAVLLSVMTDREVGAEATEAATPDDTETNAGPVHIDSSRRPDAPLLIRPDHNAGPARVLPGVGPDDSVVVDPVARRRRIASIVAGTAIVLGLTLGGGWWLLSRSYFVGLEGDVIVIYKGIPASLGPLSPSWVVEETSLTIDQIPSFRRPDLEQGIAAVDRGDARDIVSLLRAAAEASEDQVTPEPAATTPASAPEPAPAQPAQPAQPVDTAPREAPTP